MSAPVVQQFGIWDREYPRNLEILIPGIEDFWEFFGLKNRNLRDWGFLEILIGYFSKYRIPGDILI